MLPEQLLDEYYLEDNFEVVDFKHKKDPNTCYVFFSSNGLYKDRNDIDIIKRMHEVCRYEWKFIAENKRIRKKASRIIFLRDIYKIFYIRGISKQNNSIDKIVKLLKNLTKGMDVILAGSSAGAYMALLVGNMLSNTKKILTLGGVVDLESFRSFSGYLDCNLKYCDYIDIRNYIFGDYWIVNFYGKPNNYDSHNGKLIDAYANHEKLINVGFDIDIHAPRPSGEDLIKLLVCNNKHLYRLKKYFTDKENIKQISFSSHNIGFLNTYFNVFRSFLVKFKKRHNHDEKAD